jgi:hypothetical protein
MPTAVGDPIAPVKMATDPQIHRPSKVTTDGENLD